MEKNGIHVALIVLVEIVTLCLACCIGFRGGVKHVIDDAIIYAVDVYNPENPAQSAYEEYDQQIFVELDGVTYDKGMYQG